MSNNYTFTVNINADMLSDIIEHYCMNHTCPNGCIFDKVGACTQENPFNTIYDRVKNYDGVELEEK